MSKTRCPWCNTAYPTATQATDYDGMCEGCYDARNADWFDGPRHEPVPREVIEALMRGGFVPVKWGRG